MGVDDENLSMSELIPQKTYAPNKSKSALKLYDAKIFMAKSARLSYLEKTSRAEGWQGFEATYDENLSMSAFSAIDNLAHMK